MTVRVVREALARTTYLEAAGISAQVHTTSLAAGLAKIDAARCWEHLAPAGGDEGLRAFALRN